MDSLEGIIYEISKIFLTPVLVVLSVMFVYALFALGMLMFDLILKGIGRQGRAPLLARWRANQAMNQEAMELYILKTLEPLRITSRVAPMLGLVATMIPMGPALIAVSSGDSPGIAENLVVAFSAVIVALLSAAVTYVVLLIRRRWLISELHGILQAREAGALVPASLS